MPVLMSFTSGQAALDMEQESDEEIVRRKLKVLQRIFKNVDIPTPCEAVVTRWSQDPFAKGTYSFVAQGANGLHYDKMSESVNNVLYFAGEATCREYPSSIEGAYLSGLRVASEMSMHMIEESRMSVLAVKAVKAKRRSLRNSGAAMLVDSI